MPIAPARSAAFDILLRVERESSFASQLLHSKTYSQLSPEDHALVTELVMGVLRWRSRLDEEISAASSHPLSRLDPEILVALRLAVYQFRYLDRVPPRAALHESVELVKRARKRSAAPFVNAVLRTLSSSNPRRPSAPARVDSPEALSKAFAHPLWLVARWARQYGLAAAGKTCQYDQSIPTTIIRLHCGNDGEAQLLREGISLAAGAFLASARRVQSGDVTKTSAFREGRVAIQEEASQLIAALVAHNQPSRILDCCAAPGGKTLAIADLNPKADITAVELHPHRARLLQKFLRTKSPEVRIKIISADAQHLPLSARFDRVLVDVPCSGTGTLGRNPEIKWHLQPRDLEHLQARQLAILRSALAQAAPGGRLIYSTCSLEKEENEDVIDQVLAENKSFRLLDCPSELEHLKAAGILTLPDPASITRGPYLRTIPGVHVCDGFFAALIARV
jgi:16S rRNA (cytosine967-C5)-methyltransferase